MAQCPNCSQSIAITEDHFGTLYRCEHCRAEFFIGFDGVPENSKEASPEPTAAEDKDVKPAKVSAIIDVTPPAKMDIDMNIPDQADNDGSGGLFNIPENPQEQGAGSFFSNQQNDFQQETTAPPPNEVTENTKPVQKPGMAFKNFAQDVEEFGNEVSLAGVLSFDIEISGIDIAEMKNKLLDALDDKRFGWNLDDISENIKDGKLKLEKMSAPKIIVLVKRITPLGLSLNWRHNVSTQ